MRNRSCGRSMEGDQEAWITIGRCRRCGSQETAGLAGITPDVDTVAAMTTCW